MKRSELLARHKYYKRFSEKWSFWCAAYEGTEALLDWGVLEKHERETNDNFEARKKEACGFEYSQSIVDLFNHYLFQKECVRQLGRLQNDDLWKIFQDDCDLYGTDLDTWLNDQAKWAGVYGHIGILVDKANIAAQTREEQKTDKLYPYLCVYHPPAIWDWRFERDQTGRPYLAMLKLEDEDGRIRIWYPDRWEVYSVDEEGDDDTDIEPEETGTNFIGKIPFVWLINTKSRYRCIGISDIKGVARIDASILRNLSHGEEVIKYSAFPMMRKPMRPAGVSEEQEEDVAGVTGILEFDPSQPEAKPDWLEAKTKEPIDAILLWIARKVEEIYRSVNAGGLNATESSTQAKSGVALREEFQLLNAKLVAKASNLEEAERNLIYLWCLWENREQDYDQVQIERPKDFSVEDLAADLEHALSAKTLIQSPRFHKELQKILARLVLPSLSLENQEEIDKEIEKLTKQKPNLASIDKGLDELEEVA